MLPTAGSSAHRTSVFELPPTIEPNFTVSPAISVAVSGATTTENSDGRNVTSALADVPGCSRLLAVIVTFCELLINRGAVYTPSGVIVPNSGLRIHVTGCRLPREFAVNCCRSETDKETAFGLTSRGLTRAL